MSERMSGPENEARDGEPVNVDGYPGRRVDTLSIEREMVARPGVSRELYLRGSDGNIVGIFPTGAIDTALGGPEKVVGIDLKQNEETRSRDGAAKFRAQVLDVATLGPVANVGADYRVGELVIPAINEMVVIDRGGVKLVPGEGPAEPQGGQAGIRTEFRRRLRLAPRVAQDVFAGGASQAGWEKAL
jgi:hypothetical protein